MLTVTRKYTFDSAHSIPGFPDGHRCRAVHGHTYRLHVTWAAIPGSVVSFEAVEPDLLAVVALVDHRDWQHVVPTGLLEDFAPWLWGRLQNALRKHELDLVALRLCEGERSEVAIDDRGVPQRPA